MWENFPRDFREMFEKLRLFCRLETLENNEKFLENLSNVFNDFVSFKKNLFPVIFLICEIHFKCQSI